MMFRVLFLIFLSFTARCDSIVYFDPDAAMKMIKQLDFVEEENRVFNRWVGTINRRMEEKQQELAQMEREMIELTEMGLDDDVKILEEQYRVKMEDFRTFFAESDRKISARRKNVQERIEDSLIETVNELSREKGYDVVIEKSYANMIYADPRWDVTDEIVDLYRKKYKSVFEKKKTEEPESSASDEGLMDPAVTRLFHLGLKYNGKENRDKACIVWNRMISRSPAAYTVVIHAFCDMEKLSFYMERLSEWEPVFYLELPLSARPCYRLCCGLYAGKSEAEKALDRIVAEAGVPMVNPYIFKLKQD